MADDLDRKIKQIADMFGVSDTKNLKNIVESFAASKEPVQENESSSQDYNSVQSSNTGYYPPPGYSPAKGPHLADFLSKANEMVNMFNNFNDSRITLLNSVQPFLKPQRQQRLNSAVQLLKIISIVNGLSRNNQNTQG